MKQHFKKLRIQLYINSKIIIWHQWRLYKRRKAAHEEKRRKALEAKEKKKPKKFGVAA